MIPSPSIRHRTDPLHAGSLSAGSAPACIVAPDRLPARACKVEATQFYRPQATTRTVASQSPWHALPTQIPIAPAAPSGALPTAISCLGGFPTPNESLRRVVIAGPSR
jgi:hypothetical protein